MESKIVLMRHKSIHSWEALGLGYLASYSYKFGFKPKQYDFFDLNFDKEKDLLKACERADFLGCSVTSFSAKDTLDFVKQVKNINPKISIIWGGYGVNGFTQKQLIDMYGQYVDYFIQGPGEEAWVKILIERPKERILNLGQVANMDNIPFPDRELIKIERHFEKLSKLGEIRKTSMEMQRGACPFNCIFCGAHSYCRDYKRTRTASNIVGEMRELSEKYGMDKESMVLMCDAEVFLTEEVYKMAQLKINEGVNFKYGMNVVASTILKKRQREILEKMQESDLTEVWMGVESDETLMNLTGKPINPKQVKDAFKITKEMGLIRKAYFILGFTKYETKETILNRVRLIEEIDPDEVGFTIYIPVPGSRDYNHDIHSIIDYKNSDEYFNDFTHTDTLSNEELRYWQEYLVNYFSSKANYRQSKSDVYVKDKPGRSGY